MAKLLLGCSLLALMSLAIEPARSSEDSSQAPSSKKVQLGVYVESLCPDSRRFFSKQLMGAQRDLGHLFEANIVPFGHARVLGNNKMACQHGQRECEGNRRMACVLARAETQEQKIMTLGCMFESADNWRQCVSSHLPKQADKLAELEACSTGAESYRLMELAEKATGKVGYVPHLTLEGAWDEHIQSKLEWQLKKSICEAYKAPGKPSGCEGLL